MPSYTDISKGRPRYMMLQGMSRQADAPCLSGMLGKLTDITLFCSWPLHVMVPLMDLLPDVLLIN